MLGLIRRCGRLSNIKKALPHWSLSSITVMMERKVLFIFSLPFTFKLLASTPQVEDVPNVRHVPCQIPTPTYTLTTTIFQIKTGVYMSVSCSCVCQCFIAFKYSISEFCSLSYKVILGISPLPQRTNSPQAQL